MQCSLKVVKPDFYLSELSYYSKHLWIWKTIYSAAYFPPCLPETINAMVNFKYLSWYILLFLCLIRCHSNIIHWYGFQVIYCLFNQLFRTKFCKISPVCSSRLVSDPRSSTPTSWELRPQGQDYYPCSGFALSNSTLWRNFSAIVYIAVRILSCFISFYVYDKHNMDLAVLIFLKTYVCKHEYKHKRYHIVPKPMQKNCSRA